MGQPVMSTVLAVLGAVMVLSGLTLFFVWYREHWRKREHDDEPTQGVGEFLAANAFFHFGMLLLVLGGVGVLYFALR